MFLSVYIPSKELLKIAKKALHKFAWLFRNCKTEAEIKTRLRCFQGKQTFYVSISLQIDPVLNKIKKLDGFYLPVIF